MPYRNRALPTGDIVVHPARDFFMGNRRRLHDDTKELRPNRWQRLTWITFCLVRPGVMMSHIALDAGSGNHTRLQTAVGIVVIGRMEEQPRRRVNFQ